MIEIPERKYKDSLFNDMDKFYKRIFGQIPEMIHKYGENKYLIRVFVQLASNKVYYPEIFKEISTNYN